MIVEFNDQMIDCWVAVAVRAKWHSEPGFWGSLKRCRGLNARADDNAWLSLPNYHYVEVKS